MNRYQRRRSKEIKQLMKRDKFGRVTYKQARRYWNWLRRGSWCSPCEDCDSWCLKFKEKPPIAFCPNRR